MIQSALALKDEVLRSVNDANLLGKGCTLTWMQGVNMPTQSLGQWPMSLKLVKQQLLPEKIVQR